MNVKFATRGFDWVDCTDVGTLAELVSARQGKDIPYDNLLGQKQNDSSVCMYVQTVIDRTSP